MFVKVDHSAVNLDNVTRFRFREHMIEDDTLIFLDYDDNFLCVGNLTRLEVRAEAVLQKELMETIGSGRHGYIDLSEMLDRLNKGEIDG